MASDDQSIDTVVAFDALLRRVWDPFKQLTPGQDQDVRKYYRHIEGMQRQVLFKPYPLETRTSVDALRMLTADCEYSADHGRIMYRARPPCTYCRGRPWLPRYMKVEEVTLLIRCPVCWKD
jgi:hypothetical protein